MLISCKCLNFVASTSKLQRSHSTNVAGGGVGGTGSSNGNPDGASGINIGEDAFSILMSQEFERKYPRDFMFHSQFMNFFKHAYGPVSDLHVAVIKQRELIYGLTLEAAGQSWQLSLCVNCKEVLCAKRLTAGAGATPTLYLINWTLVTTSEELAQRKTNKAYSETFELLIMDQTGSDSVPAGPTSGISNSASSLSIGSLSSYRSDAEGQRLRMIEAYHQARLQEEISLTNERIERYTRNQFQFLNSFREKSDQDLALLFRVIHAIPFQASEMLDHAMPPALDVAANQPQSATARRRNTISSRRELNGGPTTPTTTLNHPPSFLTLNQQPQQQLQSQQQQTQQQQLQQPLQSVSVARKMSHFDTPPATPEATPMSVGNSPTFRQQSAATGGSGGQPTQMLTSNGVGQSSSTDDADDCLFELEDVDAPSSHTVQSVPVPSYQRNLIYQQEHHHNPFQQLSQQNGLGSVLDDETADEAEDALDPDSSISIPVRKGAGRPSHAQLMNFARSLPIEIANTTLAERAAAANNNNFGRGCEEGMDNIDIAASIQALTKSIHGEAVFGDLPRPRLRSQIEG
ncbi:uncharacterized protein LOC108106471 [Drosophila eugracilis]|uniref:uncharacterized protein LOC108106471 n=1 Tax=Drosophila eugracilis TaxID=29029 RepID=UPI0007E69C50|nr:uncharacterized protein LOC108106471 [Drosophila eugracilis]